MTYIVQNTSERRNFSPSANEPPAAAAAPGSAEFPFKFEFSVFIWRSCARPAAVCSATAVEALDLNPFDPSFSSYLRMEFLFLGQPSKSQGFWGESCVLGQLKLNFSGVQGD
ncbi:hypothetical protein AOLI_G00008090 [Acnodon oligacanthus]